MRERAGRPGARESRRRRRWRCGSRVRSTRRRRSGERALARLVTPAAQILDLQARPGARRRGDGGAGRQRLRRGSAAAAPVPRGAGQLDLGRLGQRDVPRRRCARRGASRTPWRRWPPCSTMRAARTAPTMHSCRRCCARSPRSARMRRAHASSRKELPRASRRRSCCATRLRRWPTRSAQRGSAPLAFAGGAFGAAPLQGDTAAIVARALPA